MVLKPVHKHHKLNVQENARRLLSTL